MTNKLILNRRNFLKISATAAGGLLVTVYSRRNPASSVAAESFAPDGFVRIDQDNTVTIWAKNPDMGQGVKTSLPMIVAEELEVNWAKVKVQQADLNPKLYGGQGSGGSDNIPSEWDNLRK